MGTLNKSEADRMKNLLMEAVTTLCRSGIRFEDALRVEGLIAVTVDESDIIVVNVNKTYESPSAVARKAEAAKADAEKAEIGENDTDSGEVSDGGTPRHRRRRKKRRSGAGNEGSDREEYNAQGDSVEASDDHDTPSKRLRGNSEAAFSQGESSLDSSHNGGSGQTTGDHGGDSAHAIKIEIDSESEPEDDKDQLAAQLFGAGGDNSLVAVPLDQAGIDDMGTPMPVSMFSASSLPGTSPLNFPSGSSTAAFQDLSSGTFASPQQGSSKEEAGRMQGSTGMKDIYPCKYPGCQKTYSAKSSLQRHIQAYHNDFALKFPCPHCSYVASYKYHVDAHVRKSHADIVSLHSCPYCSFTSQFPHSIDKHVASKHRQEDKD